MPGTLAAMDKRKLPICRPSPPLQAVTGGTATYLGAPVPFDLTTITIFEVVGMAFAEGKRAEADWNGRVYPGFDPAGMAKDPSKFAEMKVKEIKNGRCRLICERAGARCVAC
eukprot:363891-Chlamydomonas_euryale.AAC.6